MQMQHGPDHKNSQNMHAHIVIYACSHCIYAYIITCVCMLLHIFIYNNMCMHFIVYMHI